MSLIHWSAEFVTTAQGWVRFACPVTYGPSLLFIVGQVRIVIMGCIACVLRNRTVERGFQSHRVARTLPHSAGPRSDLEEVNDTLMALLIPEETRILGDGIPDSLGNGEQVRWNDARHTEQKS